MLFASRIMALTVQNRVIRLEMTLRLERVLGSVAAANALAKLPLGRLIALRFASDAELPGLIARVPVAGVEHERAGEAGHSRVAAGPAARVTFASEAALEDALSAPSAGLLASMRSTPGDILILGAAGKMGPTLSRMARRALDELGSRDRVIAVSRFSSERAEQSLNESGIETVRCDLLDRGAVAALPDAPNVIFMAGQKFGTRDAPSSTWQ